MEKQNPLSKFQFIYRRSHPAVKILVIVAIVFSMLAVTAMTWVRAKIQADVDQRPGVGHHRHAQQDEQVGGGHACFLLSLWKVVLYSEL